MRRMRRTAAALVRRDGLVGLSRAERDEIQRRIDLVSRAKAKADGRPLMPIEIIVALRPEESPQPLKFCRSCSSNLPVGEFHFRNRSTGERHARCKTCNCSHQYIYDSKHRKESRARNNDSAHREDRRLRSKKRYDERRAAGLPAKDDSPRGKLVQLRHNALRILRLATDPGIRARYEARIANINHEIDRIDRRDRT